MVFNVFKTTFYRKRSFPNHEDTQVAQVSWLCSRESPLGGRSGVKESSHRTDLPIMMRTVHNTYTHMHTCPYTHTEREHHTPKHYLQTGVYLHIGTQTLSHIKTCKHRHRCIGTWYDNEDSFSTRCQYYKITLSDVLPDVH